MAIAPVGYKTQSIDTTVEAELYLFRLRKSLTLIQRTEKFIRCSKAFLELCLGGIKQRHPDANVAKVRYEFAKATLKSAFPDSVYRNLSQSRNFIRLLDPVSLALDIFKILDHLDICYFVGGSVASSLLGEIRSTEGVDIFTDLTMEKLIPLLQFLHPRFYIYEENVQDAIRFNYSFSLIDNESLSKVDIFILKDNPFPQIEFQRRRSQIVRQNPDQMLVLPTPEDIILQKLIWYRMTKNDSQRQWRDVLGVLKLQGDRLDFDYMQKWAVELSLSDLLETACTESGLEIFF